MYLSHRPPVAAAAAAAAAAPQQCLSAAHTIVSSLPRSLRPKGLGGGGAHLSALRLLLLNDSMAKPATVNDTVDTPQGRPRAAVMVLATLGMAT